MEHRAFGRTGLRVPVIGLGTWQAFDVRGAVAARRREVTDAAFETQATFFDSSPMYGESERVLGASLEGRRDRAIVATKVWTTEHDAAERQIAASLAFFGGRVDIYQVHNLAAWPRRLDRLAELRAAGTVRVLGLTHYAPTAFPEMLRAMQDERVGAVQIPYNPLERAVEEEVLPAAAERGLGVIIMRPLGQGRLTRLDVAPDALAPLRRFGVTTWPQALLKWILSDKRCHVAIPATSDAAHMRMNAQAGQELWFGPDERSYVAGLAGRLLER